MSINTKSNAPISWTRPVRNPRDVEDFEKLFIDLEKRNVIEKSTLLWRNPVVLVRKKDGFLRFGVDFRRLKDLVEQDCFEIPKIKSLILQLHDQDFFTLIDLKDMFYHIDVAEEDRKKRHFIVEEIYISSKRCRKDSKILQDISDSHEYVSYWTYRSFMCGIYR